MVFNDQSLSAANIARAQIQGSTKTIAEGEAAAITTWWTFIVDHAMAHSIDPAELAKEQLEAFIAGSPIEIKHTH